MQSATLAGLEVSPMKNLGSKLFLLLFATIFALILAAPALAQSDSEKSKTTVTKGQKAAPDADKYIKDKSPDNDPKKSVPAPSAKGGGSRGAGPWPCQVHIDNRTGWRIQIYVDGQYDGLLSSWGDGFVNTGSGVTTFFAVATFTDGSRLTWGQWVFNCPAQGVYTWSLTP
jgi:hypothetical protein